jgi:dephospho-CoA kinase
MHTFISYTIVSSILKEGLEDATAFKAIMMAGGAGSGKSFVIKKTGLRGFGMKVSNSDPTFERMLKGAGLKKNAEDIMSAQGQAIRGTAKELTDKQKEQWLKGRLGVIVDGTGKDLQDVKQEVKKMRDIGYDVAMIFVNTELEVSIERDNNRQRTLGAKLVTKTWNAVQKNRDDFKRMFGSQYVEINNGARTGMPDITSDLNKAMQKLSGWINRTPSSTQYKDWVKAEMKKKGLKTWRKPSVR